MLVSCTSLALFFSAVTWAAEGALEAAEVCDVQAALNSEDADDGCEVKLLQRHASALVASVSSQSSQSLQALEAKSGWDSRAKTKNTCMFSSCPADQQCHYVHCYCEDGFWNKLSGKCEAENSAAFATDTHKSCTWYWNRGCSRISGPAECRDGNCYCKDGYIFLDGNCAEDLKTKASQMSYIAQAAIKSMQQNVPGERGITWQAVDDFQVGRDWFLNTPRISPLGKLNSWFVSGQSCNVSRGKQPCNVDFGMYECRNDDDCVVNGGRIGFCKPLQSTVTVPGSGPKQLCMGGADMLVDDYYDVIIQAQHHVDITSLSSPDQVGSPGYFPGKGAKFLAAIRNAITFLANSKRAVTVRMLFGSIPLTGEIPSQLLKAVTRDVQHMRDCTVSVYAGTYRTKPPTSFPNPGSTSWNHGKIVAVDGYHLIYGGINFYTHDYLLKDPVFDISIRAYGNIALTAHEYADNLWKVVTTQENSKWGTILCPPCAAVKQMAKLHVSTTDYSTFTGGKQTDYSHWSFSWPNPPPSPKEKRQRRTHGLRPPRGANALALSRMGGLPFLPEVGNGRNSADFAFEGMFGSAKKVIKIAQQDVGPVIQGGKVTSLMMLGWPDHYIDALIKSMVGGADVYILVSNPMAYGGGDDDEQPLANLGARLLEASAKTGSEEGGIYGYGWYGFEAVDEFFRRLDNHPVTRKKSKDQKVKFICDRLNFAYQRVNSLERQWPDNQTIGVHAKFFSIDDQAFYVGSQNFYNAPLAEYGVLIDDADLTGELLKHWWDPIWGTSAVGAITGKGSKCSWIAQSKVLGSENLKPAPGPEGCRDVQQGDVCWQELTWAMQRGIYDHPSWYPGLNSFSSASAFQAAVHKRKPEKCPMPCTVVDSFENKGGSQCSDALQGDSCWHAIHWAKRTGIYEHPEWYPGLTSTSNDAAFQAVVHRTKPDKCAMPCSAAEAHCERVKPGSPCWKAVDWAKAKGIYSNPEWYPGLTPTSGHRKFQEAVHKSDPGKCPAPC